MSEEKTIKDGQPTFENQTGSEETVLSQEEKPRKSETPEKSDYSGISPEEADAITRGLEGLDVLAESIPEIPDLERMGIESCCQGESYSSLDETTTGVKSSSGSNLKPLSSSPVEKLQAKPASFPQIGNMETPQFSSTMDGVGINLLMDIPVKISVVLGRTQMTIGEILSLEQGTVVELDKLVGEPVEVLANSKLILKGEVVVIDENFGIRITELVGHCNREQVITYGVSS